MSTDESKKKLIQELKQIKGYLGKVVSPITDELTDEFIELELKRIDVLIENNLCGNTMERILRHTRYNPIRNTLFKYFPNSKRKCVSFFNAKLQDDYKIAVLAVMKDLTAKTANVNLLEHSGICASVSMLMQFERWFSFFEIAGKLDHISAKEYKYISDSENIIHEFISATIDKNLSYIYMTDTCYEDFLNAFKKIIS